VPLAGLKAIGSRGPEQRLAKLDALCVLSPSETRQVEALIRRVVVLSSRMTAGLLLLSGAAMLAARFVCIQRAHRGNESRRPPTDIQESVIKCRTGFP
jgi:hypothetical protein